MHVVFSNPLPFASRSDAQSALQGRERGREGMFCFNCAPYRMNHISSVGWQPLNRNECPFIVRIYHCLKRGGEIGVEISLMCFHPGLVKRAHCSHAFNLICHCFLCASWFSDACVSCTWYLHVNMTAIFPPLSFVSRLKCMRNRLAVGEGQGGCSTQRKGRGGGLHNPIIQPMRNSFPSLVFKSAQSYINLLNITLSLLLFFFVQLICAGKPAVIPNNSYEFSRKPICFTWVLYA